ncbi:MAG: glycerophosphodiester phosphodiesterase [Gammaproteobacteria bacterium]
MLSSMRTGDECHTKVLNIAHRGARAFAPENTLAAFAKAKVLGCQMIEIDVHMSKDGVLVVHHDDQLNRCTDARARFPGRPSYYLSDFTWRELSQLDASSWYVEQLSLPAYRRQDFLQSLSDIERELFITPEDRLLFASGEIGLPTLEQTLAFARNSGLLVNIELKMLPRMYPGLTDAVIDLVNAMGMASSVLISSFDHEQLAVVRRLSTVIATAVLTGERLACPGKYLQWLDADAYHPGTDTLGLASVTRRLQADGISDVLVTGRMVNVWTCNDKSAMNQLLAAGVTGLISDYPNRVRDVVAALGGNDGNLPTA